MCRNKRETATHTKLMHVKGRNANNVEHTSKVGAVRSACTKVGRGIRTQMAKRIATAVTVVSEALRPNCAVPRGFVLATSSVDMNEPSFRKETRDKRETELPRPVPKCAFVVLR